MPESYMYIAKDLLIRLLNLEKSLDTLLYKTEYLDSIGPMRIYNSTLESLSILVRLSAMAEDTSWNAIDTITAEDRKVMIAMIRDLVYKVNMIDNNTMILLSDTMTMDTMNICQAMSNDTDKESIDKFVLSAMRNLAVANNIEHTALVRMSAIVAVTVSLLSLWAKVEKCSIDELVASIIKSISNSDSPNLLA